MKKWRRESEDNSEINFHLSFNWDNVWAAKKFIDANPDYTAKQPTPLEMLLQSTASHENVKRYGTLDEPVEFPFEKNLLNSKDNFLNSEKRYDALSALLIGGFIYGQEKGILRAIKLIAQKGQQTSNSQEKQKVLGLFSPSTLLQVIIMAHGRGLIKGDISKLCEDAFRVFRSTPDLLKYWISDFNNQFITSGVEACFKGHPIEKVHEELDKVIKVFVFVFG